MSNLRQTISKTNWMAKIATARGEKRSYNNIYTWQENAKQESNHLIVLNVCIQSQIANNCSEG